MRVVSSMERAATAVAELRGAKRAIAAMFAGALSGLAFAPVQAWPILFLTFGLLVWLLDGCHAAHSALRPRLLCAAAIGFWFGFGFFLASLYWIAEAFLVEPWRHAWLIPLVLAFMPGGMALFYAAAAALAMLLWGPGPARVFALALAFGVAEFARGHLFTGLPWNLLGYALTPNEPMMQLAALFGVYALSLLAVLLFASPAAIFAPQGSALAARRSAARLAAILLICLGLGALWGQHRLAAADLATTNLRLRIVQANIDQANKWRPENSAAIFADYLALTKSGGGLAGTGLVIWPETAVPFLLADTSQALLEIADALPEGTKLLVGSARLVDTDAQGSPARRRIFNSLLLIDDKGQILGNYDKIHLVPFGEYLPFQDFLESFGIMQMTGIRGGFSPGEGPRLLQIPGAPAASPLICYEIIFPDDIVDPTQRPGWILNVTNDAWFGTSAGPYQHFQQARVRAVEQGLPVIRAANTGISAIVDPYGRIVAALDLGETGVVDGLLPRALAPTLVARYQRLIEILMLALAMLGCRIHRVHYQGEHG